MIIKKSMNCFNPITFRAYAYEKLKQEHMT
uniref:Uncharacterized protein n=1 Tax=Arundo donax TaxID=35708 RepID=A0A0A9BPZ1_ARUDO